MAVGKGRVKGMKEANAKPEFTKLTESEVMEALADPDPSNPVACEVARLIEAYTENFKAYVEKLGYFPAAILTHAGTCPIEAIAKRLTTEAIRDTLEANRKG